MRIAVRFALILMALAGALYLTSCREAPTPEERALSVYPTGLSKAPKIRVLVKDSLESTTLNITGAYELRAVPEDPRAPIIGSGRDPVTVTASPSATGGIKLGAATVNYPGVCITPVGRSSIMVDNIDYGGEVILLRSANAKVPGKFVIRIVIRIDMEQYLVGVVPSEMYVQWPMEALRAQCVASRTYALYKIKTRGNLDYDVACTQASQVWNPATKANPRINSVVNSTRGVIMTDNWRLFPAYFSSQCGGKTKDGEFVFISRHINPLTGVKCEYCQGTQGGQGGRKWQCFMPLSELAAQMRAKDGRYKAVTTITGIKALDAQGRRLNDIDCVYDVAVECADSGKIITMPALDFRNIIGVQQNQMASTYFRIDIKDNNAIFTGIGNGHGVGMCQYGAGYLANRGIEYRDILAHYYQGMSLARLWGDDMAKGLADAR